MKNQSKLIYEEESYLIRGGAFEIYKQFRNRHKEVVYGRALAKYLSDRGLKVEKEKRLPVYFEDIKVGTYTPDIVVNDLIFIELKCKSFITREDQEQFWHYLKISDYKLGFLINFGATNGVQIVRRIYDKTSR